MESLYFDTTTIITEIHSKLALLENSRDEGEAQKTMQYVTQLLKYVESVF